MSKVTLTKVSFRGVDKAELAKRSCIVHISVGQAYHEGDKFIATMDLINETFRSCKIMVCDTLQKHSLKIMDPALSDDDAYQKALLLGEQWLERNSNAYSYLDIDVEIYRWDQWLRHPEYSIYRAEVENLYKENSDYRAAIHATIEKFLTRQNMSNNTTAFNLSKIYILEECPILIPLWAKTGCEFVVYPRFRTPAMAKTYQYFLGDKNIDLLREVALKFNHRVTPKPLSFKYESELSLV